MVWNVQAPWDVYPSPTLCGLCLKVLRGRNGDADKKPIPTLTKDENRPSGRTTGLRADKIMGFSNTEEFKKKYIEIETEMQKGNFREYRYNSAFETAPVICQYIKSEELGSRN